MSPRIVAVVSAAVALLAVTGDAIAAVFGKQLGSLTLLVVAAIVAGSLLLLTVGILLFDILSNQVAAGFAQLDARLNGLDTEVRAKLEEVEEQGFSEGLVSGIRAHRGDGVVEMAPWRSR
jgi:hypothetical protein